MRTLLAALSLLLLGTAAEAQPARHVVVVSLDGFRPEFYLDPAYATPALRALVARGSHARAVEPVFPSVTYPNHASIVTGRRPAAHGVPFNQIFEAGGERGRPGGERGRPGGERGRWYEEAADLRASPLWEWARSTRLKTAAVSWPSTLHARIDLVLPERDYYQRPEPLDMLTQASTPGLFRLTGVTPDATIFKDVLRWDEFLARTAASLIRGERPNLLLLHLVQLDYFQHRSGRDGPDVKPAAARVDAHIGALVGALREAGLADRAVLIVTGDHGFQDYERAIFPNEILVRAGLRACPKPGDAWRASVHVAGGSAAVFVNPTGNDEARQAAETALRGSAQGRFTLVSRRQLDELGAMTGAAFAIEAAPGHMFDGGCGDDITRSRSGGTHGFLPSRPTMATGLVIAGPGVRGGVALERASVLDVAPTAARLLGIATPVVEGRVLVETLQSADH